MCMHSADRGGSGQPTVSSILGDPVVMVLSAVAPSRVFPNCRYSMCFPARFYCAAMAEGGAAKRCSIRPSKGTSGFSHGEIARLEGDRQFAGGHRGEPTGSNPCTAPSCKMRHDLRRHKLMGLHVVAIVAVDQQLYAGVLVLADQIDGLRHGADKAP
jgi:hypothetical protein